METPSNLRRPRCPPRLSALRLHVRLALGALPLRPAEHVHARFQMQSHERDIYDPRCPSSSTRILP